MEQFRRRRHSDEHVDLSSELSELRSSPPIPSSPSLPLQRHILFYTQDDIRRSESDNFEGESEDGSEEDSGEEEGGDRGEEGRREDNEWEGIERNQEEVLHPTTSRTTRVSTDRRSFRRYKLDAVLATLRYHRWSICDLLAAFIQETDENGHRIILPTARHQTPQSRQRYLRRCLTLPVFQAVVPPSQSHNISAQLAQLRKTRFFGEFDMTTNLDTLNYGTAIQSIRGVAPTWHQLVLTLLQNSRGTWQSYNRSRHQDPLDIQHSLPEAIQKIAFMITSIICFSQAKKTSDFFPSILDLYFLGSGVKRQVVETLAGLGIFHRYHTGNTLLKELAKHSKVH